MTSAYNLTSARVVSTGDLIFHVYVYIIDLPVVHLHLCGAVCISSSLGHFL